MSLARLLSALSLCLAVPAHAASPDAVDTIDSVDSVDTVDTVDTKAIARARARRTTGIALTTTGAVIGATGASMAIGYATSMRACDDTQPDCNWGNAMGMYGGGLLGLTALPLLGAGIPLWVSGNRRLNASTVGVYGSADEVRIVLAGRW